MGLAPGSHQVFVVKTLYSLHRARISREWRLRIGPRLSRIDPLTEVQALQDLLILKLVMSAESEVICPVLVRRQGIFLEARFPM